MTTPLPPPPPPTPPPPPAPPAPETVVVNLPPEVVDRLTPPEHSWIYDNVATLSGAVIALLAAVIAYFAILYQVKSEDRRHRRAERLAVVTEAYDLLEDLYVPRREIKGSDLKEALQERNFKVNSIAAKLRVLGLGKEANAIKEFRDAVDSYNVPPNMGGGDGGMHLSRLDDYVRRLLANAIEDQVIGPPPPSSSSSRI